MSNKPGQTCDLAIENVQAMQPGEGIIARSVRIRDGRILAVGGPPASDVDERFDGAGRLLTPGLIDLHTHGIHRFGYEIHPDHIVQGARLLGRYGTTCVLPTLYNVMRPGRLGELEQLASAIPQVAGTCMPGFHLEGPCLALPGAGGDTVPVDLKLLEQQIAATASRVCAMSISPDTPNILSLIERLCDGGIAPFITHTKATVEQTQAAIAAGARHATHFCCVFPCPDETDPGVRPVGAVEAILADPRCTVDFICDGVHTHPIAVRATLAAKGYEAIILITDSNIGAGLPEGIYDSPTGYRIRVAPDEAARVHEPGHPLDGVLAGSALTMDLGMTNLLKWLDLPPEQIWAMGTLNPARLMGWTHKGSLHPGADADLVLWGQDTDGRLQAVRTWLAGECVYQAASVPAG